MTMNDAKGKRVDVLKNVEEVPETGCFLWAGTWGHSGYGRVYYAKKMWLAHRLSWTLTVGPIPPGAYVCHRCDTPSCINTDHLFLGTAMDNCMDMVAKRRHWLHAKTKCSQGHELSGENLRFNNRGDRICIECNRLIHRESMRRARAKEALNRIGGEK